MAVTTGVKGKTWEEKTAQRQQVALERSLLAELKQARDSREQVIQYCIYQYNITF